MKYILIILLLTGCSEYKNRCIDGVLYVKYNNAYIESGDLKHLKCISASELKEYK